MQVVIKIPDGEYERLMNMKYPMTATILETAIRRGTPLPKGHGRLIDADVLKEQMIKYGFHTVDMTVIEFIEDVLPTIIEADTESEAKE